MGFFLCSFGLLVLVILIAVYRKLYGNIYTNPSDMTGLFECIAGYGLGGSTVALFGRVGGGIYTKAADVGADLVGKLEHDLPEDSPKNPATIADNVGDNVGDIAGMGSDLFGSFAEATSAALAVAATSPDFFNDGRNGASLYYPLVITAFGLIGSFITSFFATNIMKVKEKD
jgi:Na+/H+-translocating membrane pyrophosphatase